MKKEYSKDGVRKAVAGAWTIARQQGQEFGALWYLVGWFGLDNIRKM